jgi:hypothetical protein
MLALFELAGEVYCKRMAIGRIVKRIAAIISFRPILFLFRVLWSDRD